MTNLNRLFFILIKGFVFISLRIRKTFGVDLSRTYPLSNSEWTLCADKPPIDNRMWPSLGNGHIGMAAQGDTVFMNGLYNGNGTTSSRARIPAFTSVILGDVFLGEAERQVYNTTYCLCMHQGMFVVKYINKHWMIEMKIYAHRKESRLLVTQITIIADGYQSIVKIPLHVNHGNQSEDIKLVNGTSGIPNTRYKFGHTREAETPESGVTPVHVYHSIIPDELTVNAGKTINDTHVYLMSISTSQREANTYFKTGLEMVAKNSIESTHVTAWEQLWDAGRVDIYGNQRLASLTYSSLYYIFSALPIIEEKTWPFVGLSPSDLAHNGYNGHVFWDQDTWMYPPVLMFHINLGKTLLETRLRTLDSALEYARLSGSKGARYPWESALTGYDVTPSEDCRKYEIHINGDIGIAFQQYLLMTGNTQILRDGKLNQAIHALADYWVSRSTFNMSRNQYEILDVMPPDEWSFPVNNSVYTNYIAQKVLRLPGYVCKLISCEVPSIYNTVADRMFIPYDTKLQYHPEYEGYNNVTVKQADVILLGWPLEMEMSEAVRRNDLEFYAKVTPAGPAMSWGMFAIGWLDVEEHKKANVTFYKQQHNRRDPFNMWTENADGSGATNFITGMGGYLQSIIFGYAGVRMKEYGLVVNCHTIPDTSAYRLKDIDYYGNSVDIVCDSHSVTLTIVQGYTEMSVLLASDNNTVPLKPRCPLSVTRQKLIIIPMGTRNDQIEPRCSTDSDSMYSDYFLAIIIFGMQLICIVVFIARR